MLRVGSPHYYGLRADSTVGGERYERELLSRLPEHGVAVRLGLPSDAPFRPPRWAGASDPEAVPEGSLEGWSEPVPAGWQIDWLPHDAGLHWTRAPRVFVPYARRLLRGRAVDVLRGESVRFVGPSLLAARALSGSAARRVPIVLHHHHLFPRWARIEAFICTRADAVVTVSEHSRDALVAAGVPREQIHVFLQGIDRPARTAGAAELWPAAGGLRPEAGGLRLLSLGRLEPRKRPALAIEALAASHAPASLVVAGAGKELPSLKRLAGLLGVAERVTFLGEVDEDTKWRLYDAADLLLFGSTLEGFGLVVAEAQSRGVPVIAASGAATSEALDPGVTGILTAPTAGAFAAVIDELAADPERRVRMSTRAVPFSTRFDWDRCAAGVADLYRAVAAGASASPSPTG